MESKKKKIITGSVIGVVVLALSVALMGNTIMARFFPDKYVLLSLAKMQKISQEENKTYQLLKAKHKKTSLNISLKEVNEADPYYQDIIDGLGLSLSVANSKDKDIMIDLGLKKHAANLMELRIFSSEDELGVIVPGLLEQYITVKPDNFKEEYDQTLLPTFIGDIEQEDVNVYKKYIAQARDVITSDIENDYKDILLDLARTADIEYIGKEEKANRFIVHFDSKDVKTFVQAMAKSTLQENIDEYLSELKFSDLHIVFIIDRKKHILDTNLSTTVTQDGEMINIQLTHLLSGDKNIFDQTKTKLILGSGELEIQLEKDKTISDDLLFNITNLDEFDVSGLISLEIEDLKDTSLKVSDSQKLELFSIGPMQIIDLVTRLGSQASQVWSIIGDLF